MSGALVEYKCDRCSGITMAAHPLEADRSQCQLADGPGFTCRGFLRATAPEPEPVDMRALADGLAELLSLVRADLVSTRAELTDALRREQAANTLRAIALRKLERCKRANRALRAKVRGT